MLQQVALVRIYVCLCPLLMSRLFLSRLSHVRCGFDNILHINALLCNAKYLTRRRGLSRVDNLLYEIGFGINPLSS
jgi:hypothetical protein